MPKHIYITKEMLESKLKTVSVRDLANMWSVSESTIVRLQKKYDITRTKNSNLAIDKIKKYAISIDHIKECDNILSYIFGFIYARGRIYNNYLIIQCPIKNNSIDILKLINNRFNSTYPILQVKNYYKLIIRDEKFIKYLIDLNVLNSNEFPDNVDKSSFEAGISSSISMGNTIVNNRNEKIIELLENHDAVKVAEMMQISVSRVRKIKKRFKLFEQ